jgi:SAM-dependent methyltransferase
VVSESDVIMAYRLIMGREPESATVVRNHARNFQSLQDMRTDFMNSAEFHEIARRPSGTLQNPGVKTLNWPAEAVEVDVAPDVLERMIGRIEGEFLSLGRTEPHWSVLTADRFKSENIHEHEDEFYASGAEPVEELRIVADRCKVDLTRLRSCFELGCGLGRSTIWLARQFDQVIGGDISAAHLEHARQAAARFGMQNITFTHLNQVRSYQALPGFDMFFSMIVLQHNPPPLMARILETILHQLAPGGIAYFQIPTYLTNYAFSASTYLESAAPVGNVEVHCIPQTALFAIIERTGCRVLEIREDGCLGANAISNRILLRKG